MPPGPPPPGLYGVCLGYLEKVPPNSFGLFSNTKKRQTLGKSPILNALQERYKRMCVSP